jgi:hypothetical protein
MHKGFIYCAVSTAWYQHIIILTVFTGCNVLFTMPDLYVRLRTIHIVDIKNYPVKPTRTVQGVRIGNVCT